MKRIVSATDFSARSRRAMQRATRLAKQHSADLILVHVVDDDQPDEIVNFERVEATRYLTQQVNSFDEFRGVKCEVLVTTGDPFDGILNAADSVSADLIVMGSHRRQLLRDVFVGTTIERVVRTGALPVLMVNSDTASTASTQLDYNHVIAATDMSASSAHAIKSAEALGFLYGVAFTIAHAFTAFARGKLYLADAAIEQIDEYLVNEHDQVRMELIAFLMEQGLGNFARSILLEEGGTLEVLSRIVTERTPDLLVIGTHGRSGIAKIFLGSVAEEILRSFKIDILVVPRPR